MSSVLFKNKKDGWWKLKAILESGDGFHNSTRSFRGGRLYSSRGLLPTYWGNALMWSDTDYIIYSYGTPIAWRDADSHRWVMPDVKYGPTTSGHQGIVLTALSQIDQWDETYRNDWTKTCGHR